MLLQLVTWNILLIQVNLKRERKGINALKEHCHAAGWLF